MVSLWLLILKPTHLEEYKYLRKMDPASPYFDIVEHTKQFESGSNVRDEDGDIHHLPLYLARQRVFGNRSDSYTVRLCTEGWINRNTLEMMFSGDHHRNGRFDEIITLTEEVVANISNLFEGTREEEEIRSFLRNNRGEMVVLTHD